MSPRDVSTTGAVNVPGFPFCHFVHSARQPIDRTEHLVDGGMGWGKERKTKAIDINDLPATRGPQAGPSEGPLDTN